ncbi:MAG: response regulator transcription factor [Acidobacteria bacterium]|nr:response regulator transcription factor [Acidobacteriota bacterium]
MKKRILVVEDDEALGWMLCDNLTFEGFEVQHVGDGNLALTVAREFAPDLVVLDVMLPGRDGFDLVGLLRQSGPVPIIMLTARGQKADKLKGLKLGADDYVTKPFDIEELMARVHNVLRRSSPEVQQLILGRVTIDFQSMTARHGRGELHVTNRELVLLRYLAERPGRVVSRHELLREVWGYPDMPTTRLVDNAIARLRKKIEPDPGNPRFVHTVRGDGYTITPEG